MMSIIWFINLDDFGLGTWADAVIFVAPDQTRAAMPAHLVIFYLFVTHFTKLKFNYLELYFSILVIFIATIIHIFVVK